MTPIVVVDNPSEWALKIPGIEIIAARDYLIDSRYMNRRRVRVYNLCRSYRYQSIGYYVSLLAQARGHRPQPGINTIQDMKSQTLMRTVSEDLDEVIQKSLRHLQSSEFVLSIYFGRNLAKQHARLASHLFNLFPAPMLRARFVNRDGWELQSLNPIAASEIPHGHQDFVIQMAREHFKGGGPRPRKRFRARYDLAILFNPDDPTSPSNLRTIRKFAKAGRELGLDVEIVDRQDYGEIAEYDALFIRETTAVNHHTYRFARRASSEDLVVIDDPDSILKCTNKVFLAELLARHELNTPRTRILQRANVETGLRDLGLPCVLKQPDSSSSLGVVRPKTEEEYHAMSEKLLSRSELIIAQEYLPTDFDWRIGILDRQPIYACRYYMVGHHWQIVQHLSSGKREGRADTLPLQDVPPKVMKAALRAANLIGGGLYGVDVKEVKGKVYVIEVNDNPSIEAGCEDLVLGDALYQKIMQYFVDRLEARSRGAD